MSDPGVYQQLILKLREEEFKNKRQIILMSSGLIGLPATLLGTGNLTFINQGLMVYSWLCFILNIIIGVALLRDIIDLNIKVIWYKNNEEYLERFIGNPLNEVSDVTLKNKKATVKSKKNLARSKLNSRLIRISSWAFYLFFISGLLLLALSALL